MSRFDVDVSASDCPLQETPKVFYAVGMNLTSNICYGVVYSFVDILFVQVIVGIQGLGKKVATLFHGLPNRIGNSLPAGIGDYLGFNFATTPLQESHNDNLANTTTTFDDSLSLCLVHIASLATYVCLIRFYSARQLAIIFASHRQADSVKHKPSSLLSDAEISGDFIGTNAVLGISNHPDSGKPFIQTNRAILEDCAYLDRELTLGMLNLTLPYSPSFDKAYVCASAGGTSHAVRPAQLYHEVQTDIGARKVFDCFYQGSWFIHCCAPFLTYTYMIAQLSYCVKYINALNKGGEG